MSWILTFHTIFTARMGSFEVRAAAKLKDFISLLVNGLLGGRVRKRRGVGDFPFICSFSFVTSLLKEPVYLIPPTHYELIEMATRQVKRMKNTLITSDFLIFYMNRRNSWQ